MKDHETIMPFLRRPFPHFVLLISACIGVHLWFLSPLGPAMTASGESLTVELRDQVEVRPQTNRFHTRKRTETWRAEETAIIVCDVWDAHHCLNAVRRLEEFVPRLNDVLVKARDLGATIIHSPSDCMPAYVDHPARKRTIETPRAANHPPRINEWCSRIPGESRAAYPIDQSDGGEDDSPQEHAEWSAELKSQGRNPAMPWQRQHPGVAIDADRDYVGDRGEEVWNVLEARGIRHVVLVGVHANMCVLGRPFGLRHMVRGGRQVVLMRDLTDAMYDPTSWPYVDHFTGNDLVVDHVERYVCPTITSDQILGDGGPFRSRFDRRPHVAIVVAEQGYDTERTLPEFAADHLVRDFRVSYVYASATDEHDLPNLEVLDEADAALFSVRRRPLRPEQMAIVRRFVAAKKGIVGLRTASHAFALRDRPAPAGTEDWPEFDVAAFGAKYLGHPQKEEPAVIVPTKQGFGHRILLGLDDGPWTRRGGLYEFGPLSPQALPILTGANDGSPPQPVAWTFDRTGGGHSFYCSLGEPDDFKNPNFVRLLHHGLAFACRIQRFPTVAVPAPRHDATRHWTIVELGAHETPVAETSSSDPRWLRAVVRVPAEWKGRRIGVQFSPQDAAVEVRAWWNGRPVEKAAAGDGTTLIVAAEAVEPGEANLLVVRSAAGNEGRRLPAAPAIVAGDANVPLIGRWQQRRGDDPTWSNMPLPAKFGTPTDIVFDVQPEE